MPWEMCSACQRAKDVGQCWLRQREERVKIERGERSIGRAVVIL